MSHQSATPAGFLVIARDPGLAMALVKAVTATGSRAEVARASGYALARLQSCPYQGIIIDAATAGDLFSFLLQERSEVPLFVLSATCTSIAGPRERPPGSHVCTSAEWRSELTGWIEQMTSGSRGSRPDGTGAGDEREHTRGARPPRPPKRRSHPEQSSSIRAVIIEDGARGVESYVAPDGGDQTLIIREDSREPAAHLALRVVDRLIVLERSEQRLNNAALLCSMRRDPQTTTARRLAASALFSHLKAAGTGELVFVAEGADAELRASILSIVDTLTRSPGGIAVRASFEPHAAYSRGGSGVFFTSGVEVLRDPVRASRA